MLFFFFHSDVLHLDISFLNANRYVLSICSRKSLWFHESGKTLCESGFQAEPAAAPGEKVALYFSINIFPSRVHLV